MCIRDRPLALNEKELERIIEAYRESGKTLTVGFNRRFSPHIEKIKSIVGNAQMNVVATMNAGFIPSNVWVHDMKIGGGRIIGEACHYICLLYTSLIIGKTPPPIGGVTIYVERLLSLAKRNKLEYAFYDLNKFNLPSFIKSIRCARNAHLNTSSSYLRLLFTILCKLFATNSIITIPVSYTHLDVYKRQPL